MEGQHMLMLGFVNTSFSLFLHKAMVLLILYQLCATAMLKL